MVKWVHKRMPIGLWKWVTEQGNLGWMVGEQRWEEFARGERTVDRHVNTFVSVDGEFFREHMLDARHRSWRGPLAGIGGSPSVTGEHPHLASTLNGIVDALERHLRP
jgi:hypothetical protein